MLKRVRQRWISSQAGEPDERSFKGDVSCKANRFIGVACICAMNARAGMRRTVETIATRAARWPGVTARSRWIKSNHLLLVSQINQPFASRGPTKLDFTLISNTAGFIEKYINFHIRVAICECSRPIPRSAGPFAPMITDQPHIDRTQILREVTVW